MGLFSKAHSVQKASKAGLLEHSKQVRNRKVNFTKIDQAEVDALLSSKPSTKITFKNRKIKEIPSSIPLSWNDAGIAFPPAYTDATLTNEELQSVLKNKSNNTSGDADLRQKILCEIGRLEESIEAPAHLFSVLKVHLEFTKAALLLYDPLRMVFAPWASVGYDETTLHRLRIPIGFNKIFNLVANGDLLYLTENKKLDSFKRCFSSHDFASLEYLLFVPIIFNNKLIAVLLISEMGRTYKVKDTLFQDISKNAAPVIFRAREEKMNKLKRESIESSDTLEQKAHSLAKQCFSRNFIFIIIKLSLDGIVQNIAKINPLLDQFRLKEDIINIIHTLFSDTGKVYSLNQQEIILFIHLMPEADPQLLIHHLASCLAYYFKEIENNQNIRFNEEIKTAKTIDQVTAVLSELV